jgi:hypothetical protein
MYKLICLVLLIMVTGCSDTPRNNTDTYISPVKLEGGVHEISLKSYERIEIPINVNNSTDIGSIDFIGLSSADFNTNMGAYGLYDLKSDRQISGYGYEGFPAYAWVENQTLIIESFGASVASTAIFKLYGSSSGKGNHYSESQKGVLVKISVDTEVSDMYKVISAYRSNDLMEQVKVPSNPLVNFYSDIAYLAGAEQSDIEKMQNDAMAEQSQLIFDAGKLLTELNSVMIDVEARYTTLNSVQYLADEYARYLDEIFLNTQTHIESIRTLSLEGLAPQLPTISVAKFGGLPSLFKGQAALGYFSGTEWTYDVDFEFLKYIE